MVTIKAVHRPAQIPTACGHVLKLLAGGAPDTCQQRCDDASPLFLETLCARSLSLYSPPVSTRFSDSSCRCSILQLLRLFSFETPPHVPEELPPSSAGADVSEAMPDGHAAAAEAGADGSAAAAEAPATPGDSVRPSAAAAAASEGAEAAAPPPA